MSSRSDRSEPQADSDATRAAAATPITVLYQDADIVAAVKPAGMLTHSADGEHAGFVEQLSAQLGLRLGTHQRLDAATSGLLLFSVGRDGAKGLAEQFESRRVEKVYRAVCIGTPRPGRQGTLRHRLMLRNGRQHVVERGGDEAITHYRVLSADGPYALCEVRIETGRTHQIRAQFAASGAPILGDTLYGGGFGTGRLLLHAWQLVLPHPVTGDPLRFEAAPPPLLDGASLCAPDLLSAIVDASMRERAESDEQAAMRLLSGIDHGVPGVRLDRYGAVGVLRVYEASADPLFMGSATALSAIAAAISQSATLHSLYRLVHHSHGSPQRESGNSEAELLYGEPVQARWAVREGNLRYWADLDQLGCGLYLDQVDNRRWIGAVSSGARMLNLFAYTASFSVVAAAAGATTTTSVDLSAKALAWAKDNFTLNGIALEAHRFYRDDVLSVLARLARRGEAFEIIVCDPPSFSRHGKRHFSVAREWAALVGALCQVAAPGAQLLLCTNHRQSSLAGLRKDALGAIAAKGRHVVSQASSAENPLSGSALKTLRLTLD